MEQPTHLKDIMVPTGWRMLATGDVAPDLNSVDAFIILELWSDGSTRWRPMPDERNST